MAESTIAPARAVRGMEAAAFVLRHAVEAYAVAGGEGARRLGVALAQSTGGPEKLAGEGLDAARAALGCAAAGRRTALVVSGDSVIEALPAIREMARGGIPVLIVIPSHGPDIGASLPAGGLPDIAPLRSLAMGLLVASDAGQLADLLLVGLRAASDRSAPWAVAFELAQIGLALANTQLPDEAAVKAWASSLSTHKGSPPEGLVDPGRHVREVERFGFALGAAMRDLERVVRHPVAPVIFDGARDPDVVLIAAGSAARSARHAVPHVPEGGVRHAAAIQVASLRPFPAAEIVRLAWRARAVIVHEPHPDPLGVGGSLTDGVRASFADALTWHPGFAGIGRIPPVMTVVGETVTSAQWLGLAERVAVAEDAPRVLVAGQIAGGGRSAEGSIEIAMDDAGRESALRFVVDWLARTGVTVSAQAHEPTRARLSLARDADARGPATLLLACVSGAFEPSLLDALPPGSAVVLAGAFPDRVLADTLRTGASRGIRVATLHAVEGVALDEAALAAAVRVMLPAGSRIDEAFEAALSELPEGLAATVRAQTRAFGEALRAQFA